MSGRPNAPLAPAAELVGAVTKLRGEAAREGIAELERDLTAVLNFVVFGDRRRGELEPAGAP